MNEYFKRNLTDNESKLTNQQYSLNSFRGHISDKAKYEKDTKQVISPRLFDTKDYKEGDHKLKISQNTSTKPRILTSKLPSAFDMRYRK